MAFCRNCGSEVPEGTKFCSNCGTPVRIKKVEGESHEIREKAHRKSDAHRDKVNPRRKKRVSGINKYGKFYGIVLMIMAFVDYVSDPAFLTIILSIIIIGGCIFCFNKRYKLKGFTVIALILAIFCLLCGISQAKKIGLFTIPENGKTVESSIDEKIDKVKETTATSERKEKPTVNGVDPNLKAFLDSYESFIDEYVVFMKKYMNDPSNAVSMISEYTEIMKKYTDFAEKIDKYDADKMSTEDAKYYLEVVNRCNQKMLDLY